MTAKAAKPSSQAVEDVRIDNGSAAAAGVLRSLAECLFRSEAHPLGWTVWCVWVCAWCMLWAGKCQRLGEKGFPGIPSVVLV